MTPPDSPPTSAATVAGRRDCGSPTPGARSSRRSPRPHASADELFGIVARTVPGTSLQSVYNALGDFVDAGLVRRIEPAGRPGLFELRVDDNHLTTSSCSECGAVEDVDCVDRGCPVPHAVRRARLRRAAPPR